MRSHKIALFATLVLTGCSKAEKPTPPTPSRPAPSSTAGEAAAKMRAAVEEFKNRKIYSRLSADILATIPDDKVEQAIVDFVGKKSAANGGDERRTLQSLSIGFRTVYATWIAEAEVNNGGFNQFFWNSSGQHAVDAAQGFARIGAPDIGALVREAIEIEKKQSQRLKELKRRGTLEDFSESYQDNALTKLDRRFFDSHVDISALRVKYIRANPELFAAD